MQICRRALRRSLNDLVKGGASFSVLTGSKCGKDMEQRITKEAVTRVSMAITALTGLSCCKAYVRASLDVAVDYLKESLGIGLFKGKITACDYSPKHPHGAKRRNVLIFLAPVSVAK